MAEATTESFNKATNKGSLEEDSALAIEKLVKKNCYKERFS